MNDSRGDKLDVGDRVVISPEKASSKRGVFPRGIFKGEKDGMALVELLRLGTSQVKEFDPARLVIMAKASE